MRSRPRVMVLSWYAPDKMDAGELIRLGQITSSFEHHAEVLWSIIDGVTVTDSEKEYLVPVAEGRTTAYSIAPIDYLRAFLCGQPIELYRLGHSRRLRSWVSRLLLELQPDIVWINQPFVWPLIPSDWWSRCIVDTHNVNSARLERIADSESNPLRAFAASIQARLTRGLEAAYLAGSAMSIAVSDVDRSELLRSGIGADVRVIPNGVDLNTGAHTKLLRGDEGVRLLFLGSLGYSANLSALRRLADWLDASPDLQVQVTVAGSGRPDAARAICAEQSRMRFVGRVDSVATVMGEHHALIAPHSQGSGSRIKVLEAMGNRLPVIGTEVAVEGLGLSAAEHYFPAENAEAFRAAVCQLGDHEEVLRRAERAWLIAGESQWSALSERAWLALSEVLDERSRAQGETDRES